MTISFAWDAPDYDARAIRPLIKQVDRPRIIQQITDARTHGDLSENALRQSLIMSQGSLTIFFTRPIAGGGATPMLPKKGRSGISMPGKPRRTQTSSRFKAHARDATPDEKDTVSDVAGIPLDVLIADATEDEQFLAAHTDALTRLGNRRRLAHDLGLGDLRQPGRRAGREHRRRDRLLRGRLRAAAAPRFMRMRCNRKDHP